MNAPLKELLRGHEGAIENHRPIWSDIMERTIPKKTPVLSLGIFKNFNNPPKKRPLEKRKIFFLRDF